MRAALPILILAVLASGCRNRQPNVAEEAVAAPAPAAVPSVAPKEPKPTPSAEVAPSPAAMKGKSAAHPSSAASEAAHGNVLTGKLLERIDATPYCYLRLLTAKGEVWAAIPEAKLEQGTLVTVDSPQLMANFESKTLKRTFPEIYFGTLPKESAPAMPAGHPHGKPTAPASTPVGKVEKASGVDARTVAEIWSQKSSLTGQTVTVRGRIVKYTSGVLGKNWIHLQDGSGDPKKGTHDLTVTTQDKAANGDVVTLRGILQTSKDFGSGYAYEVLLEDAVMVKQ